MSSMKSLSLGKRDMQINYKNSQNLLLNGAVTKTQKKISNTSENSKTRKQIIKECIFCQKYQTYLTFGPLLNKALYSKYSSSQNYYFSKDINDIMNGNSTPIQVKYKDFEVLDESEEYLKRFYKISEYQFKIQALTEYYKYHKDIARMFMLPISNVMNRFHDKKRKIEYVKIKKMLNLETSGSQSGTSKSDNSAKRKKKNEDSQNPVPERVLEGVDISSFKFQDLRDDGFMRKIKLVSPKSVKEQQLKYQQQLKKQKDLVEVLNEVSFLSRSEQYSKVIVETLYTESSNLGARDGGLEPNHILDLESISFIDKKSADHFFNAQQQKSTRTIQQLDFRPDMGMFLKKKHADVPTILDSKRSSQTNLLNTQKVPAPATDFLRQQKEVIKQVINLGAKNENIKSDLKNIILKQQQSQAPTKGSLTSRQPSQDKNSRNNSQNLGTQNPLFHLQSPENGLALNSNFSNHFTSTTATAHNYNFSQPPTNNAAIHPSSQTTSVLKSNSQANGLAQKSLKENLQRKIESTLLQQKQEKERQTQGQGQKAKPTQAHYQNNFAEGAASTSRLGDPAANARLEANESKQTSRKSSLGAQKQITPKYNHIDTLISQINQFNSGGSSTSRATPNAQNTSRVHSTKPTSNPSLQSSQEKFYSTAGSRQSSTGKGHHQDYAQQGPPDFGAGTHRHNQSTEKLVKNPQKAASQTSQNFIQSKRVVAGQASNPLMIQSAISEQNTMRSGLGKNYQTINSILSSNRSNSNPKFNFQPQQYTAKGSSGTFLSSQNSQPNLLQGAQKQQKQSLASNIRPDYAPPQQLLQQQQHQQQQNQQSENQMAMLKNFYNLASPNQSNQNSERNTPSSRDKILKDQLHPSFNTAGYAPNSNSHNSSGNLHPNNYYAHQKSVPQPIQQPQYQSTANSQSHQNTPKNLRDLNQQNIKFGDLSKNRSPVSKQTQISISQTTQHRRSKSNIVNIFLDGNSNLEDSKKVDHRVNLNFALNFPGVSSELFSGQQQFSSRGPSPFRQNEITANKAMTSRVSSNQHSLQNMIREKFTYK